MRKFIAIFLVLAMMVPIISIPGLAKTKEAVPQVKNAQNVESAFAEGKDSLILFVTGIGQSRSYLFDERYLVPGAFEHGTLQDYENYAPLIANGKAQTNWNLFNKFDEAFKDKNTVKSLMNVVSGLLLSMFLRKNTVRTEDIETVIRSMFHFNMVDEEGNLDPRVVTPRYAMSLAEYPMDEECKRCEAKERFYSSIPCAEVAREKLGDDFEKYIYCYNYSAFSYTSDNVEGLHEFIETVLKNNKVGAKDVVLVPMSMGASVVSAYLAKYPQVSDNHVRRVVSIVGCWEGSDVLYDLVTRSYVDNSAELFYNGIIGELIGEPWGYVVNVLLRLFPKAALRNFIDQTLEVLTDNVVLDAPSLIGLIPTDKYAEVRNYIDSDVVKAEADAYNNCQKSLNERMTALENQGVTFSFISGYGLPYGAITSDYRVFGFMKHSATTNSDEIINIESTAPGTKSVKPGTTFTDSTGRMLSPDGSIDIAGTYRRDSSWFFYGQKHELEHNNTAIELALELALGKIKTIDDCDDLVKDGYFFPQFNESRDLKKLNRDYIPALEKYCADNNYTLNEKQQKIYDDVIAMKNCTVNDRDKDDELIDTFYNMLIDMGIYNAHKEPGIFEKGLNAALKGNNDLINKIFGAKGFLDGFSSVS